MINGICAICGEPLSLHRDDHNRSLTCEEIHWRPLHVTVRGQVVTLRTKADVYRLVAQLRKAA